MFGTLNIPSTVTSIFFPAKSPAKIATIQLDCSVSETHSYKSTVTDYPTEEGFYIQDNVYLNPFTLTMKGIITDTPLGFLGENMEIPGNLVESPLEEALDNLLMLRDKKIVFDVVTGLKIYSNMIFTNFEPTRDLDTARSLQFTAELKQIRKASSQIIEIHNDKTNDKKFPDTQNKGTQQASKIDNQGVVPNGNQSESWLYQLLHAGS